MKRALLSSLLILFLAFIAISPPICAEEPEYFTIVTLPDTQVYSMKYPEIFKAQTQWIVDNQDVHNIVFVVHEGDIVNNADQIYQWENARGAMDLLAEADIPFSVVPGNHDVVFDGTYDSMNFNAYFPWTEFAGKTKWYGNNWPPDGNESSYALISSLDFNLLIMNIGSCPSVVGAYDFANRVISNYDDWYLTIVVTHGYIDTEGTLTTAHWAEGPKIWNFVVRQQPSVFLVLCGHMHIGGVGRHHQVDIGNTYNDIQVILANFQGGVKGGNGYLRLHKFYPSLNKVEVSTYSPYIDKWIHTANHEWEFQIP